MSLPYIISSVLLIPLVALGAALILEYKKTKILRTEINNSQKNHENQENFIKEALASIQYGKTLENVLTSLTGNLAKTYPYSSLSSAFIKNHKITLNSNLKDPVNRAFFDHIKDTMTSALANPENTHETEESITGVPFDDVSSSTIISSIDLKITVRGEVVAVINLSSTSPNLYNNEDTQTLTSVSELISEFLNRFESIQFTEKSKALSMIDSFSEGIFMVDINQNLIAMNNAALNFLKISKQNPNIHDILLSLPNTYNFKDKIETSIAINKQIIEHDVPIMDKIFRIIITPVLEITTTNKNIIGVSVLLQDTTLEKSLSRLKEDFTNIMVHELRSPITAIKASSEFLESRADFTDLEKKQLMRMISDSSKKMLDKITLILDSAKMEAGLFSIKKTHSDLKKLIFDRVNVFTPVASEKSINLKMDLDEALPNFPFDPMRIDEVINNLLSNSLKFTPNGGLIQVNAHQVDGKIKVSVTDTGSGIPKDKQHLLFSKFQQAEAGGQHQGTGLGLYVVKGVVEAHGGTVFLESVEGHGTTISFSLPLTETSSAFALPTAPKVINPMSN